MTRTCIPPLAAAMVVAAISLSGNAAAQQPPVGAAPEPKMPPMPSMEGQQGDVSKPVTQIPSKKKTTEKPAKEAAERAGSKPASAKKPKPKTAPKKSGSHKRH